MNITNTIKIRGIFRLSIYKKGSLIETVVDRNQIVSAGLSLAANIIAGAMTPISKIGVGTSSIAATTSDIGLANPQYKNVSSSTFPSPGSVDFTWGIAEADFVGMNINEFGLLTSGNTLFARKVRTQTIVKTADISLSGVWTILFESEN
jgi:hypothetical protein